MQAVLKIILLITLTVTLSGCFVVTTPVKIAADTVSDVV